LKTLFVVNGPTATLVASYLASTEYKDDEVAIVIEQVTSAISVERQQTPESYFYLCCMYMSQLHSWDIIMSCTYKRFYVSPLKSPLVFLRESSAIKKEAQRIYSQLPWIPDRIVFSGNSLLQNYLYTKEKSMVKIEHGLGDYMHTGVNSKSEQLKRIVRRFCAIVTGVPSSPTLIDNILCDGAACKSLSIETSSRLKIRRVAAPDIQLLNSKIDSVMGKVDPSVIDAFEQINKWSNGYQRFYIYLPSESVPLKYYEDFLDEQLSTIDLQDCCFLIKRHPVDHGRYIEIFSNRGLNVKEISHKTARHFPVELLLARYPNAVPLGAGSSALFYAKWWLNRESLYRDGTSRYSAILDQVRSHFYEDILMLN
jgi:hypothetical protein